MLTGCLSFVLKDTETCQLVSFVQVVLPIGTIVKIEKANDLLNVWITPSPYDFTYSEGEVYTTTVLFNLFSYITA